MAQDEQSSLGFSADEVVDRLDAAVEVQAFNYDTRSNEQITLSFAFETSGDSVVEESTRIVTVDKDDGFCLIGRSLSIPVTVQVDSPGLFHGRGQMTVLAQAPGTAWVSGDFDVTPSPALDAIEQADKPSDCSERATTGFTQYDPVSAPWPQGPIGGLSTSGCNWEAARYSWGDPNLPSR